MLYYITDEQLNKLFQAVEDTYGPQENITIKDIPIIINTKVKILDTATIKGE